MRLALTVLVLFCATRLAAADLSVVRIWPGYRTADSFQRISEFFTGRENTSGQIVLRTRPDARAGFYFLTRIKNSGASLGAARFELDVITQASPKPARFTFPIAAIPEGKTVFQIGLTGTDWPEPAANPVAWQLRLLDASGQELLRERSFLWSQSPAP